MVHGLPYYFLYGGSGVRYMERLKRGAPGNVGATASPLPYDTSV